MQVLIWCYVRQSYYEDQRPPTVKNVAVSAMMKCAYEYKHIQCYITQFTIPCNNWQICLVRSLYCYDYAN
jgi:hypothetical protein